MKINSQPNSSGKLIFFILLGALALRLILLLVDVRPLRSDSLTYHKLAQSILMGEYAIDGRPTAFVVPGYPLFLAGIYSFLGEGQFGVRLVQSFLDVLTCLIFYVVCRRIFNERLSLTALCIFAFFPSNALYTQAVLTETLFGFFAMIVLFFVTSEKLTRQMILTGLLFGIAILVRSSFSLSAMLVPLYLFVFRKELFGGHALSNAVKHSLIFVSGLLISLSPWLIRNTEVMGALTLATQSGGTLWEGNNPRATGTWNKEAVDSNPLFDEPDEIRRDSIFRKQAVEFIISNPVKFIELGFRKLGYLFSSERMALLYFMESPPGMNSTQVYRNVSPLYSALVNVPYFFVMLSGAWGLLLPMKKKFFVTCFIAMWMLTMFVFVALPRYHYVLIPFFILGTVNLLHAGFSRIKDLPEGLKIAGTVSTIFLLGVWITEFYLLYFGNN